MQRIDPGIAAVWLISNEESLADNLAKLSFKPTVYSFDYRLVNPELIDQLRQRDVQLVSWTVNEPEVMQQLKDWGVDALITDYPDIALEVLREG